MSVKLVVAQVSPLLESVCDWRIIAVKNKWKREKKKHKNVGNLRMMIHLTVHIRSFFISICVGMHMCACARVLVWVCQCVCVYVKMTHWPQLYLAYFLTNGFFSLAVLPIATVVVLLCVCIVLSDIVYSVCACVRVCKSHAVLYEHTSEVVCYSWRVWGIPTYSYACVCVW